MGVETQLKKRLLRLELDGLARAQLDSSARLMRDLDTLEAHVLSSRGTEKEGEHGKPLSTGDKVANTLEPKASSVGGILIVPGDSGFAFQADFRMEFISYLYAQPQMWLPSYGPWFTRIVATVMQRRVFPKELKGNTNLQNSISLALMKELLSTVANITSDVYADGRHVSDTLACLCILNAYYCKKRAVPIPSDMGGLLDKLAEKLSVFITDFREYANVSDGGYNFVSHDIRQRETYVPVNKGLVYERGFFGTHKVFNFLVQCGILALFDPLAPSWARAPDHVDLIYVITSTILGENVPPFMTYQYNLRAGLVALEILMLVYTLSEFANPVGAASASRRLQLRTLLGDSFTQVPCRGMLGRLKVLSYLLDNYFRQMVLHDISRPMSDIFPGACLVSMEARHLRDSSPGKFVNLTGQQFNDILDTIVQRRLILDLKQLYVSKVKMRLALEAGLSVILSAPNPTILAQDILRNSFAAEDDYDRLYFIVLGCLPVAVPVV